MPYYSFNIKKGKYQIEMSSDDVYFARRQVDNLFEKLLNVQGKLRVVLPTIDEKKVINETKDVENQTIVKEVIQKTINPEKKVEVSEKIVAPAVIIEHVEEVIEEIPEEKIIEPVEEVIEEISEEEIIELVEEIIEEIPEEEIIEPVQEIIEEISEEEIVEPVQEIIEEIPEKTLFESILEEKTSEITEEEQPLPEPAKKTFSFKNITEKFKTPQAEDLPGKQKSGFKTSQSNEPEPVKKIIQGLIFPDEDEQVAKTLEEKIINNLNQTENNDVYSEEEEVSDSTEDESETEELPEEINEKIQERFSEIINVEKAGNENLTIQNFVSMEDLIAIKKPESKLDFLLLTAYFLQNKQNLFKYSLKQINSKAMPFLGSLIDHSVIHNAVAHDFVEVVPDYNGSAEVTEYSLTVEGENYFLNELS